MLAGLLDILKSLDSGEGGGFGLVKHLSQSTRIFSIFLFLIDNYIAINFYTKM